MKKIGVIILLWFYSIFSFANANLARDPFAQMGLQSEGKTNHLFKIHYAKAEDLAKDIRQKNAKLLSADGQISVDQRTNALWVQDYAANVKNIAKFIHVIDVPVKQVLIAASIVNVDESYVHELGVQFGATQLTNNKDGLSMDLPLHTVEPGHFGLAVAKLGNGVLLDLELEALESEGHGKIISNPRLVTANRKSAEIEAGEEVPYQEKTGDGNTSVAFKKAVLRLKVTPEVSDNNKINLHLTVNQDKMSAILINGVPAIQTRAIKTEVSVKNGQTIVLGGIYETVNDHVVVRVPFLGSIPLIGALFRSKQIRHERKQLLIFVTPKILS